MEARLSRNQQRLTPQRRLIARVLHGHDGHVNVDDLHQLVRRKDKSVGYATVYRMLKLLEDYELVQTNTFVDGTARYEIASKHHSHHDHLVCKECGTVVEFENEEIERLQELVAAQLGFDLVDHKMVLYGRPKLGTCCAKH
ncbi:MAG TPA: transcriptional repressor [Myxococcales bacterium]|nr:transcriptional repressor [Myxococcales bacterium]HAN32112.1 transcriptional repressor [Myxococcales bacterium]